jgi:hypothetical protein
LKSIAITGSINAITTGAPDDNAAREYTNDSWNNITQEYARESKSGFIMYCSSKKEAELAIWDFVKVEKPHFSVRLARLTIYFESTDNRSRSLYSFPPSSSVHRSSP